VGREERGADRPPRRVAAGQEVIGGALSAADEVEADGEDAQEIEGHDREVEGGEPSGPSLEQDGRDHGPEAMPGAGSGSKGAGLTGAGGPPYAPSPDQEEAP